MSSKRKSTRDQNRVGYYPFLALGHDTAMVSRQGGTVVCTAGALARAGVPGKACRDRARLVGGVATSACDRAPNTRQKSFIAIEKSLSLQTSQGLLSRQSFPCCDRVCFASCRNRVSCVATGRGARRARRARDSV